MGQLNQDPSLYLLQTIKDLQTQVQALATQQQYQVANSNGDAVLNVGNFPLTLQTAGSNIGDPTYGMQVYDENGDLVLAEGLLPNGTYGLAAYDSNGIDRVQVGQLASGDYGLQVTDPNLNTNEIWPTSSSYEGTEVFTTTTGSPGPPSGGGTVPSVSPYIGASGDALIQFSCDILTAGSTTGLVFLTINGSSPTGTHSICAAGTTASGQWTVHGTRRLKDWYPSWTAGVFGNSSPTFSIQVESSNGNTIGFSYMALVVQPL